MNTLARKIMLGIAILILLVGGGVALFWEQLPIRLVLPYIIQSEVDMQGSVDTITFVGKNAGEQTYHIYLPQGYEAGSQHYPTLYHLHGAYVQESWARYDCDHIGGALERAVAANIIEPMIVVCPFDPDGDRMWSDSYDAQFLASTALVKDLIPHIDTTYRTIPERHSRALQGFSMGGFGAVTNGFRHSDLFAALIVWDGAIHNWQTLSNTRASIADKMFASEDYFNEWSPWTLTQDAADVDVDLFIVVGEMEATSEFGSRFIPHLESSGYPFTYHDVACPHSVPCLLELLSDESFAFLAASLAPNQ